MNKFAMNCVWLTNGLEKSILVKNLIERTLMS